MPAVESQSDERGHPGAVEHPADVPAAAIGDLHTGSDPAGGGTERRDIRLESRWSRCQAGATAGGLRHAGLSAGVT